MKTLFICLTIFVSAIGSSLIIKSAINCPRQPELLPLSAPPRASSVSKDDFKAVVEKGLADVAEKLGLKGFSVSEVRSTDNHSSFAVYYTVNQKDGRSRAAQMIFSRDPFGVWRSEGAAPQDLVPGDSWTNLSLEVREKQ